MKIGVLALQGAFREHAQRLRELGADVVEVRLPEQLEGLDGLVIPGGETTTMTRLMEHYGLDDAIRGFDGAILGTCAGMIVLDRAHLGLTDVEVDRNAYGRQVASFEADLELEGDERPLRGVFIRAPRVRSHGPGVEVLAELGGEPILLRDGRILVASFHPELTDDTRVHRRFLELCAAASPAVTVTGQSPRRKTRESRTDSSPGAGWRRADEIGDAGGEEPRREEPRRKEQGVGA